MVRLFGGLDSDLIVGETVWTELLRRESKDREEKDCQLEWCSWGYGTRHDWFDWGGRHWLPRGVVLFANSWGQSIESDLVEKSEECLAVERVIGKDNIARIMTEWMLL